MERMTRRGDSNPGPYGLVVNKSNAHVSGRVVSALLLLTTRFPRVSKCNEERSGEVKLLVLRICLLFLENVVRWGRPNVTPNPT